MLQIINTSIQDTIDQYFNILARDIQYLQQLLSKESLLKEIEIWNNNNLDKFNEQVEQKGEEYSKSEDRQRGHLEQYESTFVNPFALKWGKLAVENAPRINYNFYCVDDTVKIIEPSPLLDDYFNFLTDQTELFVTTAKKYGIPWSEGKIKSKAGNPIRLVPILFCEGDIDVVLINKAGELLGKEDLLSKIDLRQRGSCNNLDKLWEILKSDNWETIPQIKIMLYDCDTNRPNEDFGHLHRRTIPKISNHPISRGIENLFPETTIQKALKHKKAFVDFKRTQGVVRGGSYDTTETYINKDEKRNFCNWLLEQGTDEDFIYFTSIFQLIESILLT